MFLNDKHGLSLTSGVDMLEESRVERSFRNMESSLNDALSDIESALKSCSLKTPITLFLVPMSSVSEVNDLLSEKQSFGIDDERVGVSKPEVVL